MTYGTKMERLFCPENDTQLVDTATKRVLFVDGDQSFLDGLEGTLHGMRTEWQMAFSTNAQDALRQLAEGEFDVIVTDMRMPDMNGFELLTEVLQRYPGMVRIVSSATVKQDLAIRSANTAHQYLIKPCDAATLQATLETAMRIRKMLVSPKLRTLISTVTSLPSMPAVHTRLVESLANEEISSRELGEIIAEDVGMTAKILQLANSAYFGLYRYVASPSEAAVYLGVETIRALTLSTSVFSIFEKTRLTHFFIERLQRHSVVTGLLAHAIAKAEGLPRKISDSSLVGGLLHDVGKLVLATNCPKEYSDVLASVSKDGVTSHAAEQEIFGATHAEVGAYLLWLWGLPDTVCNAVAFHHNPAEERASTFTAPAAINVADALEHERSDSSDSVCRMNVDMNYLATLGLADRLPEWRRICEKYGGTEG